MWYIKGNWVSNTAAHRCAVQANCYLTASKTNCNTMVFEKFCITTRTKKNQYTMCTGFSFCLHDGRDSNKAAAHSAASNQPSGLLLSLRVPTARNVYCGSCGSKDFMAFLFFWQRLHTLAHFLHTGGMICTPNTGHPVLGVHISKIAVSGGAFL